MKTDMRQITSQMNELEAVDSFNAIESYMNDHVKVIFLNPFICTRVSFRKLHILWHPD